MKSGMLRRAAPLLVLVLAGAMALACSGKQGANAQRWAGEGDGSAARGQVATGREAGSEPGQARGYDPLAVIRQVWSDKIIGRVKGRPYALFYEVDLDDDGLNELYIELRGEEEKGRMQAVCTLGGEGVDVVDYTHTPYGESIRVYAHGGLSRSWMSGGGGETPDTYYVIRNSQHAVTLEGEVSMEYSKALGRPAISGSGRNLVTGEEMSDGQVRALDAHFAETLQFDPAQAFRVDL